MPSIYQLKPAFQNLLRPLTRGLAAAGVTANQVTLAALGLSFLAGAVIAWQPLNRPLLLLIPLTLILRMALNAIDGMLAREHDMKSRLGAILNELGDVLSDSALYLPLALVPGFNPWLVVSAVVLSVIVEMTGVVAVQIGGWGFWSGFGSTRRFGIDQCLPENSHSSWVQQPTMWSSASESISRVWCGSMPKPSSSRRVAERPVPSSTRPMRPSSRPAVSPRS